MISVGYCDFAFLKVKSFDVSSAYYVQPLLRFSYNPCFLGCSSGSLIELDLFINILVPACYTLLLTSVSCLKMQLFFLMEIACLVGC